MANEWNAEKTKDFMEKVGSEVDDLCKQLKEETDWRKKQEIIDKMMICLHLMSRADTAHKRYMIKKMKNTFQELIKRFGSN